MRFNRNTKRLLQTVRDRKLSEKYLNKPQYKASKQTNQKKEAFMQTTGYNLQAHVNYSLHK